jgi:hypothetical protein
MGDNNEQIINEIKPFFEKVDEARTALKNHTNNNDIPKNNDNDYNHVLIMFYSIGDKVNCYFIPSNDNLFHMPRGVDGQAFANQLKKFDKGKITSIENIRKEYLSLILRVFVEKYSIYKTIYADDITGFENRYFNLLNMNNNIELCFPISMLSKEQYYVFRNFLIDRKNSYTNRSLSTVVRYATNEYSNYAKEILSKETNISDEQFVNIDLFFNMIKYKIGKTPNNSRISTIIYGDNWPAVAYFISHKDKDEVNNNEKMLEKDEQYFFDNCKKMYHDTDITFLDELNSIDLEFIFKIFIMKYSASLQRIGRSSYYNYSGFELSNSDKLKEMPRVDICTSSKTINEIYEKIKLFYDEQSQFFSSQNIASNIKVDHRKYYDDLILGSIKQTNPGREQFKSARAYLKKGLFK